MRKVEFTLPSIAGKATSLFQPRKDASPSPMFNRPLNSASPHHSIARILYAIFLTLLVLISIPLVTFKAMTYSFIEDNRSQGFMFEATERKGNESVSIVMAALPRMLYQAPAKFTLVAAVISIFLGVAHLGFICEDWKTGKRVSKCIPQCICMHTCITHWME